MRCGVGDYTARLVQALGDVDGVELEVLTTRLNDPPEGDPAWVRRVMTSWRLDGYADFLAAVKRYLPDIVHIQYPTQGYHFAIAPAPITLLACIRLGFKVVATWHEYPHPSFTTGGLGQLMLALVARTVIVVRPEYSGRVRGVLAAALGRTPIRQIPNASVIPRVRLTPEERSALRTSLGCDGRQLVSFFGFAYSHKGVDQLFEIADPGHHHLLLIGTITDADPYHARLRSLADSDRWRGHATITGFVDPATASRLLAASDAAVFPFTNGGGPWNSSLHAAAEQGTFIITSSHDRCGYFATENTYYAKPGAVEEMRTALFRYAGTRSADDGVSQADEWKTIAQAHVEIYRSALQES